MKAEHLQKVSYCICRPSLKCACLNLVQIWDQAKDLCTPLTTVKWKSVIVLIICIPQRVEEKLKPRWWWAWGHLWVVCIQYCSFNKLLLWVALLKEEIVFSCAAFGNECPSVLQSLIKYWHSVIAGCVGSGYLLKLIRHVCSMKFVHTYAGFTFLETCVNLLGPSKQAFSAVVPALWNILSPF